MRGSLFLLLVVFCSSLAGDLFLRPFTQYIVFFLQTFIRELDINGMSVFKKCFVSW